jgi:creatinine amidohydrolase
MPFFPERVRWDLIPAPGDRLDVMGLPVAGLATVGFEGVNISVPLEVADLVPTGVAVVIHAFARPRPGLH